MQHSPPRPPPPPPKKPDPKKPEGGEERRRDVRAHASPPAYIRRIAGSERVEVVNASYRGLFVRCAGEPPALNQVFKLRIEIPTGAIEVNAVAVRVVIDSAGRPGVGVRFFALSGDDKRKWESYITSILLPRRVAA